MQEDKKLRAIWNNALDIPAHKVQYALVTGVLIGACGLPTRYGIELTPEKVELFIEMVQTKLEGTDEVEREWTAAEWDRLEELRNLPIIKK